MKYGFIGCGNMGGAIAKALAKVTTDFAITDRSGKAIALAAEIPCGYFSSEEIASRCDRIFLGVKPHMMKGVLEPLQGILAEKKPLLITMAAGLTMEQIVEFAGCELPVIRIMPNTPVAIGKGVIQYCANELVSAEMLKDFLADLRHAGILDPLEERLIDAGSAISGSGPAYVYMFIEALADGAVACGIPRAKALEYAAATVIGAGEMVLATGQHPGALKDAVCSPGGSTIAGVRALENHGFRAAAMEAVIATCNRNKELGK
ncbi:MAG: pyrroline-5-carboxylate reductase [Ruminococcaceae bacterium]|nr:pyrroline-5-carboxylate reductase [Oscillospiraceae bacterium]